MLKRLWMKGIVRIHQVGLKNILADILRKAGDMYDRFQIRKWFARTIITT